MTASFLPPILTPIVTLVFPGLMFALFFVLVEQEEVAQNTLVVKKFTKRAIPDTSMRKERLGEVPAGGRLCTLSIVSNEMPDNALIKFKKSCNKD